MMYQNNERSVVGKKYGEYTPNANNINILVISN